MSETEESQGRTVEETPPPPAGGPPLRNRPVNLPHDLVRGDREPQHEGE
jgi:hypothetical protein